MLGAVIMQIPDSLASFWSVAEPYVTHGVAIILSAWAGYIFNTIYFRRKFNQHRLNELYGPMLGLIKQVTANVEYNIKVSDASNQAWREICERHPPPFEDHEKYFEPFKKSLDYENERFRKEDISALDKILKIFESKRHLAYPSTEKLYPEFLQYVDQFHRPLPYEVQKKLAHSAEPLAKLHADIEAHVDNLKRKLSGEKRV